MDSYGRIKIAPNPLFSFPLKYDRGKRSSRTRERMAEVAETTTLDFKLIRYAGEEKGEATTLDLKSILSATEGRDFLVRENGRKVDYIFMHSRMVGVEKDNTRQGGLLSRMVGVGKNKRNLGLIGFSCSRQCEKKNPRANPKTFLKIPKSLESGEAIVGIAASARPPTHQLFIALYGFSILSAIVGLLQLLKEGPSIFSVHVTVCLFAFSASTALSPAHSRICIHISFFFGIRPSTFFIFSVVFIKLSWAAYLLYLPYKKMDEQHLLWDFSGN